jgi:hypothetical protein
VNLSAIRERVRVLQEEIAELRAANEEYLNKHLPSSLVVHAQRSRELRRQQILDELASSRKLRLNEEALGGSSLQAQRAIRRLALGRA